MNDLDRYIVFLEGANIEYSIKENESNIYVQSNLDGHCISLFFELDGSLE